MVSQNLSDPYILLGRYLTFSDHNQLQWWQNKGWLLAQMLRNCHYDEHQHYQYLTLFHRFLTPALGAWSAPHVGQQGNTVLSGAGKLELSLTFTCQGTSLRMAFEPTSFRMGEGGQDPFNRQPIRDLLAILDKLDGVQLCLDQYNALAEHLTLSDYDQRVLQTTTKRFQTKTMVSWTQYIIALDLIDGYVYPQLYLHPQLKALATDAPVGDMLFDALRAVDSEGRLAPGLDLLRNYLDSAPTTTRPMFLAYDLAEPSVATGRIFLSETCMTWDRIKDLWTLGGKVGNDIQRIHKLKMLFTLLKIQEGSRKPNEFPLLVTIALHKDAPIVRPQIAFPMVGMNELSIAKAASQFFAEVGWDQHAHLYPETLNSYYPNLPLDEPLGKQAWLALIDSPPEGLALTIFHY